MGMFLMQDVAEVKRFVVTTKKRNLCGNLLKLTAETITRFCSKGMLGHASLFLFQSLRLLILAGYGMNAFFDKYIGNRNKR